MRILTPVLGHLVPTRTQVPFSIAFTAERHFQTINIVVDTFFFLDLIMSFNTLRYVDGGYLTSRREIAMYYLKGRFFVDLLSTFPFDRYP